MFIVRNSLFLILLLATTTFMQGCKNASTLTSNGLKNAFQDTDDSALTLNMKSPAIVEVNQCIPLIISLKNSSGDQVAANQNLSVEILGNPTSLYSDTGCSVVQSSTISLPSGTFSKIIYVRPAVSQSYVFEMQEATAAVKPHSFILSITNPVGSVETLKLTLSGPSTLVAGQCRSYVVSLQNNLGANKNSTSDLAITLSGEGAGGQFFTGTNCAGGAVNSVTLLNGQSFVSLSYMNSVAENVNLVADSPAGSSIQSSFFSVQVNPISTALPTQLVLSGPTSVTAGACSGPVVVKTVDASFNSTAVTSNLNFTISGGAGFSVFTNASCSTSLVSPLIATSSSSTSFYFIAASAGNFVVGADDGGSLTDGSLSVQASASSGTSAAKFALSGPNSVLAQSCSSAFVVTTVNGSGIESAVNATTTVNITGKGTGDFYADSACTSMISSLTFAAGDSSKPFYYKEANVANLTFNVDDAGPLTPASTSVAIVPGIATKLVVNGASPITLGECRAYTVTSKDANDFVSSVPGTTSINLTGAGAGVFYTDSSCVNSTSSVVINSGQSAALFYYKTLTAATVNLSADNSGGLTAGSQTVVVDPLPYSKVVLSRPVLTAGTCTAVTLTLKDTLNNPSLAASSVGVALTSNGGATFYTASNCLSSITSANILTGQSSVTVYLRDATAENITLGASSTGLTSDSWNTNVLAGSNDTLKLIGPATSSVGSCSAYDLRLEDSLGNLSAASSSISINFTGLSNAKFYSDVNCTVMASSLTLASGTSQTQIYLKGNVAENLTVGANSGALVAASKAVSLIAGTSNKLVITGAASALAGNCSALTVGVQDSFNNFISQGSNYTVTMSGNGSGSYYSDSGCTAAASTVIVTTGNSTASIWYKSNVPSALNLVAQGSGVFDGVLNLTINPLAPTKLVMTGAANILSGVCSAYSVSLQDTLNNLSAAGTAKTLNFSGALSGAFYSDSNCSLPTTSITVTSTQSTAQIYYKASSAQTPNLTVDDSGLPDLAASVLPVTVTASAGATTIALKISGASSINTNTCVPYVVMTTDTSGLSSNVTSDMTVTMGGAGTGTFYSDSACSTAATTTTILSGSSLSYIYYDSATAQNLVFSATATGASTTTLPVAVTSGSGASASRLTIVGSSSILTNSCIPYVVSVTDANGNSVNAVSNTAVTFSGGGSGSFFTENTCTTPAGGAATITAGSSYTTVYYSNGTVQNLILIAQSTGLSNGTLALAVTSASGGAISGPAVKLSFIAEPSSVSSTNENFGVQPIVAVQDSNNNVASTANSTITLAAYTDSACSLSAGAILQATTNPLNANGGIANFAGVNSTSAQVIYLRASSPGLASACSQAIQVYPAVAAKLSFSQQPSGTATAGANLAVQPQVSILNYTNQVVTTATNIVTISAYTDNTCTTPVTGTFNISANNLIPSSGLASFAGVNYSLPATIYLKATSSGLTSACSSGITVSPAAPYLIGIYTQPSTSGTVENNFSMTVRLYDIYGSLSPAAHNLSLTAYKSTNCTGTTSPITGNTATTTVGSATFSAINFTQADTMSIKVTDTTNPSVLSACSNAITVDGGAPSKLVFSVQPSATGRIYTSLVTSPEVQVQDSFSNLVKGSVNQVTLSAFTDAACTVAAGGTLFSTDSLTVTPSYGVASFPSISYSTNQTIYLKATASGLTSACSNAIVITGMPKKISANEETTCAVMDGGVWCWGVNSYNRLGDGLGGPSHLYPSQVVGVGGVGYLTNISDVDVGLHHVCALSTAGSVYCWGRNDYGQIGDNTTTTRTTPVQVLGVGGTGNLSNIISISTGYLHSCALNSSGNVFCWGYNGHGQMGDNTTTARYTPVQVKGVGNVGFLSGITAISSNDYHDCALSSAGEVYCWGYNGYGQLGVNNGTVYYTPVKVLGVGAVGNLSNIVQLSSGGHGSYGFNCAVSNIGEVYCWGYGGNGNLGDNTFVSKSVPVKVLGVGAVGNLSNISSVDAGGYHACAVNTSGATYCWGYNAQGQIGDNTLTSRSTPVQVRGVGAVGNLTNQIAVTGGSHFSCSLANDGSMYCWGQNNYGQLGDKTVTYRSVPVKVTDINNSYFTSVSVGHNHNFCAVAREKAYCWGYGVNGELGDGTNTTKNTPSLVANLSGVKQVSMGQNHGCAVLKTGELYCWGYNNWGQLGDNTTTSKNVPVQVLGVGGVGYLTNIISVSAGNYHTCAVNSSGSVFCWGEGGEGRLGNNATTTRYTPVQVMGENAVGYLSNIVSVTVGYWHACALSGSGAMYCWGYNGYSHLGDGTATARWTPVQVSGMSSGVTAISAGHSSSCAIKNGAGYCWGHTTHSNTNLYGYINSIPTLIWPSGVTSIAAGTETVSAIVNKKMKAYSANAYYAYHDVGTGEVFDDLVALSESHVVHGHPLYCAIRNTGVLYCWGYNSQSAVFNSGIAGSFNWPSAVIQPTYSDVIHSNVATGETHSCGNINGIAQCWGTSSVGALGTGGSNSLNPKPVLLNSDSSRLGGQASFGAGSSHSCSLAYNGEVNCWGDNTYGKLGNNSIVSTNKAVKVSGIGGTGTLTGVSSLAVGYRHNCTVRLGNVYCWGYNLQGQLGIDSTMSMGSPVQTKGVGGVGYLTGASQVTAGRAHSCAIKSGYVYCWGSNEYGQLGANSNVTQSNTPLQVVSVSGMGVLDNVTSITAGAYHTCALSSGITYCWGANAGKQLGNDSFTDSSYPVGVMNAGYVTLTGVNSISAGLKHTCATTSASEVYCWGTGTSGQLGNNSTIDVGVATAVVGVGAVGNLSSSTIGSGSSSNHSCAISDDQTNVYCWGAGASGQLGNGASPASQSSPVTINAPAIINLIIK